MTTTHRVIVSDALEALRTMPDASVDSIVTDPPYEIGFMGKAWDATGIAYSVELWRECLRVLKPGGFALSFGASRTWHRMAVAIEDAGFEVRDSLAWLYGSGFPKAPSALKPAFEPVVVARKPFRGTLAANVAQHGTGVFNIEAARIGTEAMAAVTRGVSRLGTFEGADGNVTAARTGRWPANVILDDEQAAELDRQSGAGQSRFFYVAKAPKAERPVVDGVSHPTVKPLDVIRWLVGLVTPAGGIVLDIFAGSGTTAEAALRDGFNSVSVERGVEYVPLIATRLERSGATPTGSLAGRALAGPVFVIERRVAGVAA